MAQQPAPRPLWSFPNLNLVSLGRLIAVVVFLIAFLTAIGLVHGEHLIIWLIAALALAVLIG
jgi:hypothetical protein